MNNKIIFVGLHNKPDKSGKLIDRIIKEGRFDAIKTNLFNVEYLPIDENENYGRATMWWNQNHPNENDVIVLLGNQVAKDFVDCSRNNNIIYLYHPASRRSHQQMNDYVKDAINKIQNIYNQS